MPEVITRNGETKADRESFRDLLTELANGSAALVRDEIDLARHEVTEKIQSFRTAFIVIGAAAFIGMLAVMALIGAAIGGLSLVIGPTLASLCIGVALGIIAAMALFAGIRIVKKTKLKPEETIRSLKEDKEWLKQMT